MARTAWELASDLAEIPSASNGNIGAATSDVSIHRGQPRELVSKRVLGSAVRNAGNLDASGGGSQSDGAGGLVRKVEDDKGAASGVLTPACSDTGNKSGAPLRSGAYIPLHGLLLFLGDLHMKTPQDILEKVTEGDGRGGALRM